MNLGITNMKRTIRYVRLEFSQAAEANLPNIKQSWRIYLTPTDGRLSHDVKLNPWLQKNATLNRRYAQLGRSRAEDRRSLAVAF